jgi:hypothetical protein
VEVSAAPETAKREPPTEDKVPMGGFLLVQSNIELT